MGKMLLIAIVWVVAVCLFAGILLTGMIAWFKHGGHPSSWRSSSARSR